METKTILPKGVFLVKFVPYHESTKIAPITVKLVPIGEGLNSKYVAYSYGDGTTEEKNLGTISNSDVIDKIQQGEYTIVPTDYKFGYLDILTDTPENHERNSKSYHGKRHFYLALKQTPPDAYNRQNKYWVDSTIGELGGESTGSSSVSESDVEIYTPTKEEITKLINRYQSLNK